MISSIQRPSRKKWSRSDTTTIKIDDSVSKNFLSQNEGKLREIDAQLQANNNKRRLAAEMGRDPAFSDGFNEGYKSS